jgi:hypothetical protein
MRRSKFGGIALLLSIGACSTPVNTKEDSYNLESNYLNGISYQTFGQEKEQKKFRPRENLYELLTEEDPRVHRLNKIREEKTSEMQYGFLNPASPYNLNLADQRGPTVNLFKSDKELRPSISASLYGFQDTNFFSAAFDFKTVATIPAPLYNRVTFTLRSDIQRIGDKDGITTYTADFKVTIPQLSSPIFKTNFESTISQLEGDVQVQNFVYFKHTPFIRFRNTSLRKLEISGAVSITPNGDLSQSGFIKYDFNF